MNPSELVTQTNAVLILLVTAVIIVAFVALLWFGFRHANWIKEFAKDFPTQGGSVIVSLTLIFLTGLVIVVRLAIGARFPEGYDTWIWALIALAGVTTGGMIGKRATDFRYKEAGKTTPVNVEKVENVTVNEEAKG